MTPNHLGCLWICFQPVLRPSWAVLIAHMSQLAANSLKGVSPIVLWDQLECYNVVVVTQSSQKPAGDLRGRQACQMAIWGI